jgi:hypothetical protein
MSDEVEKAKAAAGGEKVERTLFEKIIAREVSPFFVKHKINLQSIIPVAPCNLV